MSTRGRSRPDADEDLVPGTENPKYTEIRANTAFWMPRMRFSFLTEDLVAGTKSSSSSLEFTEY
jgi:hypothetical protein